MATQDLPTIKSIFQPSFAKHTHRDTAPQTHAHSDTDLLGNHGLPSPSRGSASSFVAYSDRRGGADSYSDSESSWSGLESLGDLDARNLHHRTKGRAHHHQHQHHHQQQQQRVQQHGGGPQARDGQRRGKKLLAEATTSSSSGGSLGGGGGYGVGHMSLPPSPSLEPAQVTSDFRSERRHTPDDAICASSSPSSSFSFSVPPREPSAQPRDRETYPVSTPRESSVLLPSASIPLRLIVDGACASSSVPSPSATSRFSTSSSAASFPPNEAASLGHLAPPFGRSTSGPSCSPRARDPGGGHTGGAPHSPARTPTSKSPLSMSPRRGPMAVPSVSPRRAAIGMGLSMGMGVHRSSLNGFQSAWDQHKGHKVMPHKYRIWMFVIAMGTLVNGLLSVVLIETFLGMGTAGAPGVDPCSGPNCTAAVGAGAGSGGRGLQGWGGLAGERRQLDRRKGRALVQGEGDGWDANQWRQGQAQGQGQGQRQGQGQKAEGQWRSTQQQRQLQEHPQQQQQQQHKGTLDQSQGRESSGFGADVAGSGRRGGGSEDKGQREQERGAMRREWRADPDEAEEETEREREEREREERGREREDRLRLVRRLAASRAKLMGALRALEWVVTPHSAVPGVFVLEREDDYSTALLLQDVCYLFMVGKSAMHNHYTGVWFARETVEGDLTRLGLLADTQGATAGAGTPQGRPGRMGRGGGAVETEEGGRTLGYARGIPGVSSPVVRDLSQIDLSRSVCAAFQPGSGQDTSGLAMDSLDLPVMLARANKSFGRLIGPGQLQDFIASSSPTGRKKLRTGSEGREEREVGVVARYDSHVGHFGECTVSFLEAAQHLVAGHTAGVARPSEGEGERESPSEGEGERESLARAGSSRQGRGLLATSSETEEAQLLEGAPHLDTADNGLPLSISHIPENAHSNPHSDASPSPTPSQEAPGTKASPLVSEHRGLAQGKGTSGVALSAPALTAEASPLRGPLVFRHPHYRALLGRALGRERTVGHARGTGTARGWQGNGRGGRGSTSTTTSSSNGHSSSSTSSNGRSSSSGVRAGGGGTVGEGGEHRKGRVGVHQAQKVGAKREAMSSTSSSSSNSGSYSAVHGGGGARQNRKGSIARGASSLSSAQGGLGLDSEDVTLFFPSDKKLRSNWSASIGRLLLGPGSAALAGRTEGRPVCFKFALFLLNARHLNASVAKLRMLSWSMVHAAEEALLESEKLHRRGEGKEGRAEVKEEEEEEVEMAEGGGRLGKEEGEPRGVGVSGSGSSTVSKALASAAAETEIELLRSDARLPRLQTVLHHLHSLRTTPLLASPSSSASSADPLQVGRGQGLRNSGRISGTHQRHAGTGATAGGHSATGGTPPGYQVTVVEREGQRTVSNMGMVMAGVRRRFPELPVEKVRFAEASLIEQVAIMRQTALMVSMHGASLSNVIFLPRGSTVLELFPYLFQSEAYHGICRRSGLEYVKWENRHIENSSYTNDCMRAQGYADLSMKECRHQRECLFCARDRSVTTVHQGELDEALLQARVHVLRFLKRRQRQHNQAGGGAW